MVAPRAQEARYLPPASIYDACFAVDMKDAMPAYIAQRCRDDCLFCLPPPMTPETGLLLHYCSDFCSCPFTPVIDAHRLPMLFNATTRRPRYLHAMPDIYTSCHA